VTPAAFALRLYVAADEDAAVELWRRTWQSTYPDIDFAARLAWWRARWSGELVPTCTIMVAEAAGEAAHLTGGNMVGFVTVDPRTGYLDQIVVAPEAWGSPAAPALVDAAKRIAPSGLDLHVNRDNLRAIRFYEKHGFAISGEEVNPRSGAPIYQMSWRG
jgi:putative acetyltransferase